MEGIIKASATVLIATILGLCLQRQGKEYGLLLALAVSVMIACLAMSYIQPVISFLERLQLEGNLDGEMVKILLKAVGIGLITEITEAICKDSGNASLGKTIQLLGSCLLLWLSLPLLERVVELIGNILEGI